MICLIPLIFMSVELPNDPKFDPLEIPLAKMEEMAKTEPQAKFFLDLVKGSAPHDACRKTQNMDCAEAILITPEEVMVRCIKLPTASEDKKNKSEKGS